MHPMTPRSQIWNGDVHTIAKDCCWQVECLPLAAVRKPYQVYWYQVLSFYNPAWVKDCVSRLPPQAVLLLWMNDIILHHRGVVWGHWSTQPCNVCDAMNLPTVTALSSKGGNEQFSSQASSNFDLIGKALNTWTPCPCIVCTQLPQAIPVYLRPPQANPLVAHVVTNWITRINTWTLEGISPSSDVTS